MFEMTVENLTNYLKAAAELEASIYRQEKVKKQAQYELKYKAPSKPNVEKPVDPMSKMQPPPEPKLLNEAGGYFPVALFLIIGVIGLVVFFSTGSTKDDLDYLGLCISVFSLLIFFLMFFITRSVLRDNAKAMERYKEKCNEYEISCATAKAEYDQAMVEYKHKNKIAYDQYEEEVRLAKRNYDAAQNAVCQLDSPLEETKQALSTLYSMDIIYPKYRELVAMCTMYEYFVTGRCSELTGPNGAYNLYESELRQNLIINRLDTIISNLEMIRQNQYMLYQEMKNTNTILGNISSDVSKILKSAQQIEKASNITAYCAQVTAQNTEALKYIALIN